MNERDRATFDAFASRFAAIEPTVAERPRTPRRTRSTASIPAAMGLLVVGAVLTAAVLSGRVDRRLPASTPLATVRPVAASTSPTGSRPGRVGLIPVDPARPPATLPPPCFSVTSIYDRAVTTPAEDALRSTSVVIGRVVDVGDAQWNTTDGEPPSPSRAAGPTDVVRLIRVDVEGQIRGATVPKVSTVWIHGGTIGCTQFGISDASLRLDTGDRFVVLLNADPLRLRLTGGPFDPSSGGLLHAWQLWRISGARVTTEFERDLSLDVLLDGMRTAG